MSDPRPLTVDERVKLNALRNEVAEDAIAWHIDDRPATLETLRISSRRYYAALKETLERDRVVEGTE